MVAIERAGSVERERRVDIELADDMPIDRIELLLRLFAFENFVPFDSVLTETP